MRNTTIEAEFRRILLNHNTQQYKYLLAISGGVDSMVLLELFKNTSTHFEVAHCNFQLRGKDSDSDEILVRDYCAKHQIPFHSVKFNVDEFKQTGNYSTEMACRKLRYDWFDEVMKVNHSDFLVTAHHLNDNIETFLINLSRGTGLKGLVSMVEANDKIFRPLIHISKEEILNFATDSQIIWQEDYTNATDDYTRNKIRHHIIPVLNEIHPAFETNFDKTLSILNQTQNFISNQIDKIRKQIIYDEDYSVIEIRALNEMDDAEFIQFQLFEKYGFKDVDLINKLKMAENSSEITSTNYRLIKNRDFLLLIRKSEHTENEIIIGQEEINLESVNLKFVQSDQRLSEANEIINADNIYFPIRLRKPKEGDFFYPLGMKNQKKLISKFFKDIKLSKIEKEKAWLLVDNNDHIIWVVNYRLDERFKLKENNKNFLNIIVC